ncbi:MFS transporter [Desulfosarcina sp. OttesenSCG-928-A07]|nr:MFS transporter [Desulfosarcina sp. OttesenSCG-928-G17]MDL2329916.1 MFS transporter [Desulfosarcina sp. OttesenSCG-928-A07]
MDTRLFSKNFLLATLINFFIALGYYLLIVTIAFYAMNRFGSSPGEAGLAASIFVIGTLFGRLFAGKWGSSIGLKRTLALGLAANLWMSGFYFFCDTIPTLLLVRFLHGAGFGIASNTSATIVVNDLPTSRYGEGLGYFMLSVTVAMAIGPYIGILLGNHGHFTLIFVASAAACVLSLFIALFLHVKDPVLNTDQINDMKGFGLRTFLEFRAIPIAIVCAIIFLCYSTILSFITPFSQEADLVNAASFFFLVYAAVVFVARPFMGRLFDLRGENIVFYPAILIFAGGMVLLSQASHGYSLLATSVLLGIGTGTIQSVGQAIAVKITPSHRLGLANSTYFIFVDIGVGLGPFLFGLIVPFAGYRGIYLYAGVISFACVFLYYLAHGRYASPPNKKEIR